MQGKVTDIEVQKKNSDRVNVYVDDQFAFPCSLELIYKFGIQKGKKLEEENIKAIAEEDSFVKGKSHALKFIERTYKTEQQLINKLIDKGYEENVINRVLVFMKEYKFIDDVRYTEAYIKEKQRSYGRRKIQFDLDKKGIDKNIIEEKLNLLLSEIEEQKAEELCNKKLKVLLKSEKDKNKLYKKLSDYLARNGYNYGIISKVAKSALKDIIFEVEDEGEEADASELLELAQKRYNIIIKSEKDEMKILKKLSDFLLRKGYKWEEVKPIIKSVGAKGGDD